MSVIRAAQVEAHVGDLPRERIRDAHLDLVQPFVAELDLEARQREGDAFVRCVRKP